MAVFVINEWLWADLSRDNGQDRQLQAVNLIDSIGRSAHRIVIIEGTAFDRKAWNLCKAAGAIVQRIAGIYVSVIRQNSDRCQILKPEEIEDLTNELASMTKPDDHYLIQALLAVEGAILVTTDNPLRESLSRAGLSCISREEFLVTYF